MKDIIVKIASTNSGWIARQLIKYLAVVASVLTAWLIGKGFSADAAAVIAAGAASVIFGVVELTLSFVARKYNVPEADKLRMDIDAMRRGGGSYVLLGALCVLSLTSCKNGEVLGLNGEQWTAVLQKSGGSALQAGAQAGLGEWMAQRQTRTPVTSAKEPVNVQP